MSATNPNDDLTPPTSLEAGMYELQVLNPTSGFYDTNVEMPTRELVKLINGNWNVANYYYPQAIDGSVSSLDVYDSMQLHQVVLDVYSDQAMVTKVLAMDVNGNIDSEGTLTVAGTITAESDVQVNTDLNVDGTTTLDKTTVDVSLDVTGTLGVTGAATLDTTLDVTGTVDFHSTLDVDGATVLGTTLEVTGDTDLNGELDVAEAVYLADTTLDTAVRGTLSVAEDADLNGALDVAGVSTIGSTLATDTERGSLQVDENLTTLGVTTLGAYGGAADTDVKGDLAVEENLTVTGPSTFNGNVVLEDGDALGGDFDITGDIDFTSTTQSTDKDTGALVIDGGVGIEKNLNVGGSLTVVGGQTIPPTVVPITIATHALAISDGILSVEYTATGTVTITLPTALTTLSRIITIKDAGGNATLQPITVETEGSQEIDGETDALVLASDYDAINLYSDGINWFIF